MTRTNFVRGAAAAVVLAAGILAAPGAFAATPTLSLAVTSGDSVQVTVHGDPSQAVTLYYNLGSTTGSISMTIGSTDGSGNFSTVISSGGYAVNPASPAYVSVNGQNSATQIWPYGSAANTASASNQQTATASTGPVVFSPSGLTLSPGQTGSITVSGGGGSYYIASTTLANVTTQALAGSTLTVTGVANGAGSLSICGGVALPAVCGSVNITVGNGASSSTSTTATSTSSSANQNQGPVNFNISNPTISVGQTLNVGITGASSSYFVSNNPSPNIATATVSASTLVITGVGAGTSFLTICGASGGCGTIFFSVVNGGTATPTTATTTATVTTTAPAQTQAQTTTTTSAPAPAAATVSNADLLAQVQAVQNQLAQMLGQLQSLQTTLVQLVSKIAGSAGASASVSVSPPARHAFSAYLAVGSHGAEVTALQNRLTAEGVYSGPVTGTFGPLTKRALEDYQVAHGVGRTGALDAATRAALNGQ